MFAKFSVKKPLTVFVAVMVVLMLAVISFTKMPTDLLPSIDLPYIAVVTTSPGSSSEKVETSVTKPIEGTLSATGGVEKVTSISRENYSMVIFQFSYGTNMDTAMTVSYTHLDVYKRQVPKMYPHWWRICVSAV